MSLAEALHEWRDFYTVIGAATATLLGSMFVVVSISTRAITFEKETTVKLFPTSVVIHLAGMLIGCALTAVPGLDGRLLGMAFGCACFAGVIYALQTALRILRREEVETVDHLWYALMPVVAYLVGIAAAVMLLQQQVFGLDLLAIAFGVLLIASIRNAWDLIVFLVMQNNAGKQ